jgi:hypothetical protein
VNRRLFILGSAAAAGCARRLHSKDSAQILLRNALAAAGGREVLARVTALRWTGVAQVFADERVINIGASTRVVPFTLARSDTWLLSDGPVRQRSLIIESDGAWTERGGVRESLPAGFAEHERQQYAIYALMLLVPLLSPRARVAAAASMDGLDCLSAEHPGAPATKLCFDPAGRLAKAYNSVIAPDGKGQIEQRFTFTGEITARGVRWPRSIKIDQSGKPYFQMTLTTFDVEGRRWPASR